MYTRRIRCQAPLRVFFIIAGIFMSAGLFAEGPLPYRVTKTSDAYNRTTRTFITLNEGDIVYSNNRAYYGNISHGSETDDFLIVLAAPHDEFNIPVKNLYSANTENVFGEDIFIEYPPITYERMTGMATISDDEMWVPNYYCDVLMSTNRETLLKFNPELIELNAIRGGEEIYWYEENISNIMNGRSMFYNVAIKIGCRTYFLVKNIKKTEYGYEVSCVEAVNDFRMYARIFPETVFWDRYKPGDAMTLYIYLDGDYMDIYVDGNEILLGTLVKVKREFIKQYQSLIKTNSCDLTNIQWPRRVDGSMGPPKETPNITLTPKVIEESDTAVDAEDPQTVQNSAKTSAMPLWAWLAFIGGAVVIAGAVVFVAKRRK